MKEGRIEVTPEGVALEGWAESADGEAKAAALFAEKQLGATEIAVRFDAPRPRSRPRSRPPSRIRRGPAPRRSPRSRRVGAGVRARLRDARAERRGDDRSTCAGLRQLPAGRLRNRRPHRQPGRARAQPGAQRGARRDGQGGARGGGSAADRLRRPRLRRRPADRGQRHRGGPRAQPTHRIHAHPAARLRRDGAGDAGAPAWTAVT